MYNSINFFQFQKLFSTEGRCLKYLVKQRWPNGFICPKCQHDKGSFIQTRRLYQCQNCRYQASVTAGTIFHKTRTPLRKWFWMLYLLSQNKSSYSVNGLGKLLDINLYKTAWLMAHKIRQAMADRDALYKLGGILEMDDSYFGERNVSGKRGRGAEKKAKVVVSVQVNEKDKPVFATMDVVPKVDKSNIAKVAEKQIEANSTIKTDGWRSYNVLKEQDFTHLKSVIKDSENASKVLPWVHILISNCKGILRGTHHGVSTKHLQRYLAEFCYRLNRRFWQDQLFERIIAACLTTKTISLAELTG